MLRSPRQERFVKFYMQEVARGGTATDAYRRAYPDAKGFNCAAAGAHNLMKRPHVAQRIKEMRMDIKRKADISFEKILTDYQCALDMAKAKDDPGNVIAAAREQAKLVGLLIDRKEVGSAGDFEMMESIPDILEAVAKMAGPEVALALSRAFKVMGPAAEVEAAPQQPESDTILLEAKPGSDSVN